MPAKTGNLFEYTNATTSDKRHGLKGMPTWRVNLPSDTSVAKKALDQAQVELKASQQALEEIPRRLDGLISQFPPRTEDMVSFNINSLSVAEGSPEETLCSLLVEYDQKSFRQVDQEVRERWKRLTNRFENLIESTGHEILYPVSVQTKVGGQLLAITIVDWNGNSNTICSDNATANQMALHAQAVELATSRGLLKVRSFIEIIKGADRLASVLVSPGGAAIVLPMIAEYVNQLEVQTQDNPIKTG